MPPINRRDTIANYATYAAVAGFIAGCAILAVDVLAGAIVMGASFVGLYVNVLMTGFVRDRDEER